jgi:hypothetical protein
LNTWGDVCCTSYQIPPPCYHTGTLHRFVRPLYNKSTKRLSPR